MAIRREANAIRLDPVESHGTAVEFSTMEVSVSGMLH
jgi:hypothetical protein